MLSSLAQGIKVAKNIGEMEGEDLFIKADVGQGLSEQKFRKELCEN